MAKVMLVEDDNNLREIYQARMQAEGYDVVTAKDGEEALVVAKAEKPELVISDVMMPKISGFEMLDILRNTDGLKDVKVIMLTALGQTDDQDRADKLGADRYLVKSQVTLEDIVKTAHDLLQDDTASADATVAAATGAAPTVVTTPVAAPPAADPTPAPAPAPAADAAKADDQLLSNAVNNLVASAAEPAASPTPAPAPAPEPAATPAADAQTTAQEEASVEANIETFVAGASSEATPPTAEPTTPAAEPEVAAAPAPEPAPEAPTPEPAPATSTTPESVIAPTEPAQPAVTKTAEEEDDGKGSVPIANKKVINPIDSEPKKDINTLLALEQAKEAAAAPPPPPVAIVATDEKGVEKKPLITPAQSGTQSAAPADEAADDDPTDIAL